MLHSAAADDDHNGKPAFENLIKKRTLSRVITLTRNAELVKQLSSLSDLV
jgi:hypothetical protein